jgi:hypothetical protein
VLISGCARWRKISLAKAGGEYFREASVLILVFGFLDPLVDPANSGHALPARFSAIPTSWTVFVLAISLVFFLIGSVAEWIRTR